MCRHPTYGQTFVVNFFILKEDILQFLNVPTTPTKKLNINLTTTKSKYLKCHFSSSKSQNSSHQNFWTFWHIFSIHIVYFFGTKKTFKMVHLNFDWRFGNPRIHRIVVSQSKRGNQWFLYLVEFQNHQQNFLRNKNLKLLWLWNNSAWPLLNTSLY